MMPYGPQCELSSEECVCTMSIDDFKVIKDKVSSNTSF